MNSTTKDGIGWVWKEVIKATPWVFVREDAQVEVAFGPELAALRRDRELLARWMQQNRRINEIMNEVFGEDKYAMPTTRDEFDAYMQRIEEIEEKP